MRPKYSFAHMESAPVTSDGTLFQDHYLRGNGGYDGIHVIIRTASVGRKETLVGINVAGKVKTRKGNWLPQSGVWLAVRNDLRPPPAEKLGEYGKQLLGIARAALRRVYTLGETTRGSTTTYRFAGPTTQAARANLIKRFNAVMKKRGVRVRA